jgi:RsiW-degrading membrane proteinase PrsW (M82 family)
MLVVLSAALLPAILLFIYVWKKDAKPEPTSQLVRAVLWGIGICIPVAFLELFISALLFGEGAPATMTGATVNAFFVAALPEEACKLLALWIVLRKNPYYDEHYDGIVYAVCVGLGFAAIENIMYVFSADNWMSVAISRALLAVPGHYAFAVIMGYYYSLYHFVDHSDSNKWRILVIPFLAHGIYDALVMSSGVNPVIGVIAFCILIYFCIKMHKAANGRILQLVEKDRNVMSE